MTMLASAEWLQWFDYPGLEVWKFLNLAIFLAVALYVLRPRIKDALLSRGEGIREELRKAQQERERARARLAEAEGLLARVEDDVNLVQQQSEQEAESERKRLAASTEHEIEKLRQQEQREIDMIGRVARRELRRFLAQRSIQLARESILGQIGVEDDRRLISESMGKLRRTRV